MALKFKHSNTFYTYQIMAKKLSLIWFCIVLVKLYELVKDNFLNGFLNVTYNILFWAPLHKIYYQ